MALQFVRKIEQAIGLPCEAAMLWECASIDELASHLARMPGAAAALAGKPAASQGTSAPAPAVRVGSRPAAAEPYTPVAASVAAVMAMFDAEAEALLMRSLER